MFTLSTLRFSRGWVRKDGNLVMETGCKANSPTKIMDFRGFDSSIILILMGGLPRPLGNFPESLTQAILVGIILVGKLGTDVCGIY